ncbi:MAG: hypothetical protein JSW73_03810 [Candidatus Woesearchaeota archaeon]|nr:MAG: hypothetical protein JSW73_03810 [Candidatus Woesearchaeota archaeon]
MNPYILPVKEFFAIEIIYFLIIAALCLAIFLRTREIYKLTGHRSIGFFRNIFLYFTIGYFFRFLHLAIIIAKMNTGLVPLFHRFNFIFIGYFSTLAVFNICLATLAKKIKFSDIQIIIWTQTIAIVSSIILFMTKSLGFIVLIQMTIFIVTLIYSLVTSKRPTLSSKLFSSNSITYGMLFMFWVISVILFNRRMFTMNMRIVLYIISILVFVSIFIRVHKRLKYVQER